MLKSKYLLRPWLVCSHAAFAKHWATRLQSAGCCPWNGARGRRQSLFIAAGGWKTKRHSEKAHTCLVAISGLVYLKWPIFCGSIGTQCWGAILMKWELGFGRARPSWVAQRYIKFSLFVLILWRIPWRLPSGKLTVCYWKWPWQLIYPFRLVGSLIRGAARSLAVPWVIWIPLALAKMTCSGYVPRLVGRPFKRHHLTDSRWNKFRGWFLFWRATVSLFNLGKVHRDFQPQRDDRFQVSLKRNAKMTWSSLGSDGLATSHGSNMFKLSMFQPHGMASAQQVSW